MTGGAGFFAGPGLYLHLPFCSAICPYCDFSVLTGGKAARQRFVDTLRTEIRLWGEETQDLAAAHTPLAWTLEPFDTLYLGGGTPSELKPEQLKSILDEVRRCLPLAERCWISLEVNPENVDPESLAAWRALGVDTLSLGVQSFDPAVLAFLGRRHGAEKARWAAERALAAGFATVSLDLIFGLPGQAPAAWRRDLEQALELGTQHLSSYQLTIHEGTPFGFRRHRGELAEMPDDEQSELFRLAHQHLAEGGLAGYEVSSFASAPEHRSRHNAKYWRHTPYLGLGPSAHSFDGRRRWWNERKVGAWERRLAAGERPIAEVETLGPPELALEATFLGLRTTAGLDLDHAQRLSGLDLAPANAHRFAVWEEEGLIQRQARRLIPTLDGLAVADALAASVEIPGG